MIGKKSFRLSLSIEKNILVLGWSAINSKIRACLKRNIFCWILVKLPGIITFGKRNGVWSCWKLKVPLSVRNRTFRFFVWNSLLLFYFKPVYSVCLQFIIFCNIQWETKNTLSSLFFILKICSILKQTLNQLLLFWIFFSISPHC